MVFSKNNAILLFMIKANKRVLIINHKNEIKRIKFKFPLRDQNSAHFKFTKRQTFIIMDFESKIEKAKV